MSNFIEFLKIIVFGVVEGFTEWLPISSTGHLILVENIVHLNVSEDFMNVFRVVIQLGAILAVLVLYFRRLNPFDPGKKPAQKRATWHLWFKIVISCLPAAVIGILFDDVLDKYLYNPYVVAAMLIIYGVIFIVFENHNQYAEARVKKVSQISYQTAFYIGLFQLLALVPGTSRSGATILGAMMLGCSRTAASEFTFFLGIPVMFGASLLKIVHYGLAFSAMELFFMVAAMVIAFIVSMYSIQFLLGYVKKHDFKFFGYYRIVLGVIVLIYFGLTAILAK
ncbi:undecaprenyl-diphosphate phosphatase [Clostridium sp. AM16-23]|nr:undecaprenyl-diphosphate phosphatase [Clostridium sp. AM16-23]RHO35227.1 undecaprenyl-diphosphate phosphatase [Clostridium sp. AM16-23]